MIMRTNKLYLVVIAGLLVANTLSLWFVFYYSYHYKRAEQALFRVAEDLDNTVSIMSEMQKRMCQRLERADSDDEKFAVVSLFLDISSANGMDENSRLRVAATNRGDMSMCILSHYPHIISKINWTESDLLAMASRIGHDEHQTHEWDVSTGRYYYADMYSYADVAKKLFECLSGKVINTKEEAVQWIADEWKGRTK